MFKNSFFLINKKIAFTHLKLPHNYLKSIFKDPTQFSSPYSISIINRNSHRNVTLPLRNTKTSPRHKRTETAKNTVAYKKFILIQKLLTVILCSNARTIV